MLLTSKSFKKCPKATSFLGALGVMGLKKLLLDSTK